MVAVRDCKRQAGGPGSGTRRYFITIAHYDRQRGQLLTLGCLPRPGSRLPFGESRTQTKVLASAGAWARLQKALEPLTARAAATAHWNPAPGSCCSSLSQPRLARVALRSSPGFVNARESSQ